MSGRLTSKEGRHSFLTSKYAGEKTVVLSQWGKTGSVQELKQVFFSFVLSLFTKVMLGRLWKILKSFEILIKKKKKIQEIKVFILAVSRWNVLTFMSKLIFQLETAFFKQQKPVFSAEVVDLNPGSDVLVDYSCRGRSSAIGKDTCATWRNMASDFGL